MTGEPDPLAVHPDARRLHPLTPVLGVVPALKPYTVPALLTAFAGGWFFLAVLGVLVVGAVVVGAVRQRYTRYLLRDDQLLVWSGVLARRVRVVSPMRVQQVEIVRPLRHRLTDLAAVQVELVGAGTGATRVELDALDLAEAARVRDVLERGRTAGAAAPGGAVDAAGEDGSGAPTPVLPPPPPPILLRLGSGVLAAGGVTGAPLLLVPVAVASLVSELGDVVGDPVGSWIGGARLAVALVALLVVLVVVVWAVVAAGMMIVRFHGFELRRNGSDVVVSRGLLDTRTSVIPLRRVQLVRVTASALRRGVGLASLDVRTATAIRLSGPDVLGTTVPVARTADVDRLVPVMLERSTVPEADRAHPPAACRRAVVRSAVLLVPIGAVLVGGALVLGPGGPWILPGGLVGAAVGALVAWRAGTAWYRRLAHGVGGGVVVATEGLLVCRRSYVPLDRVQSVAIIQDPLQRRAGLVDLVAQLAGPTPDLRLRDVDPDQAVAVARLVRGLGGIEPRPASPQDAAGADRGPILGGGGRESNPPDGDHPSHPL